MTDNRTDVLEEKPYVGAVGRLLIAALFLISGVGKVAAPALTQGYIASAGLPFPLLAYLVAIVIEVGGGILLILGYQSRIVASVMAVFTVAAATVKDRKSTRLNSSHGYISYAVFCLKKKKKRVVLHVLL